MIYFSIKENINNENFIVSGISNQLKIDPQDISVDHIAQDIHEKYSAHHKENRVYCYRLYLANIKKFPKK